VNAVELAAYTRAHRSYLEQLKREASVFCRWPRAGRWSSRSTAVVVTDHPNHDCRPHV